MVFLIGLLEIRLTSTHTYSCWIDGLRSEQTSMGHYWNKLSAPQRPTLEWEEHVEERNIKDLSRKYLGNYYDYFLSIVMLTTQRMFVLYCGVWERAKMIKLIFLWFMTSHKASPPPLALFCFVFFICSGWKIPTHILMWWSLDTCRVTQWPRRLYIPWPFKLTLD